jgi:two-component system chemotaxis response regulator CheB
MPTGFTKSMAERLDSLSSVHVKEAEEGEELKKGWVYIAQGGKHLNVIEKQGRALIHYTDEPSREGVKPCANYMYESLVKSKFEEVVCVVLTGMGADGTEGITNLKSKKKVHVISQDEQSCIVYGMPRSVKRAGLSDQVVALDQVAQEIILRVGVN